MRRKPLLFIVETNLSCVPHTHKLVFYITFQSDINNYVTSQYIINFVFSFIFGFKDE